METPTEMLEWQRIVYGDTEAARAALAFYRERGWPVDANTFPERSRVETPVYAFISGYKQAMDAHPTPPPAALAPESRRSDIGPWVAKKDADFSGSNDYPWMVLHPSRGPCEPNVIACRMTESDARWLADTLNAAPPPARAAASEGADEERWRLAGERVGVVYGCDTPDWMAETILGLRAEIARLTQALEQAQRERDELKAFVEARGFRRCDIPACNCNGWHGGHSAARLVEIGDALEAADVSTNGRTLLGAVEALIAERDQQAGALVTLRAELTRLVDEMRRSPWPTSRLPLRDRWVKQLAALAASAPERCPHCRGRLVMDDTSATLYCEAHPDHYQRAASAPEKGEPHVR